MRYFLTFYGMGDNELLGIVEIIKRVSDKEEFIVNDDNLDYFDDNDNLDYEGTTSIDVKNKDIKLIWMKKKSSELKDIIMSNVLPIDEIDEILDSQELVKEIFN